MGCGASKSPPARSAPELKPGRAPGAAGDVVAAKPAQLRQGTSIAALLEELKLSSYLPRFKEHGWDDVDHIRRDGLIILCRDVGLDLKPGHQARFVERFRPEHVSDDNMVVSISDIESAAVDQDASGGVRVTGMTVGSAKWKPGSSAEDGDDLVVVALDEPSRKSRSSRATPATAKQVGSPPRPDELPELKSNRLPRRHRAGCRWPSSRRRGCRRREQSQKEGQEGQEE